MANAGTLTGIRPASPKRNGFDCRGIGRIGSGATYVTMSKKQTPMLPPRQKRLVRESFASVADYSTSLTKLFYGRLFELAPGVRGLFKVSLEEQSKKLLEMLATIVNAL